MFGHAAKYVEVPALLSRAHVRGLFLACSDLVPGVGQSLAENWPGHTRSEGAFSTGYQETDVQCRGNGIRSLGLQMGRGDLQLSRKIAADLQQGQGLWLHSESASSRSWSSGMPQGSSFAGWRPRFLHSGMFPSKDERGEDDQIGGTEHSAESPEPTGDREAIEDLEETSVAATADLDHRSADVSTGHEVEIEMDSLASDGGATDASGANDSQRPDETAATSHGSARQPEGLSNPTREQTCMVTIVAKAFEPEMVENFQDSMLAVWVEDDEAPEALPEGGGWEEPPAVSDGSEQTSLAVPSKAPRTIMARARSVALPTYKRRFTVLRSPHIDKKSREQFEINVHKRIVKIPVTMKELPLLVDWLKDNSFIGVQLGVTVNYQTPLRVPARQ